MLTIDDAVPYLLERGLVTRRSILEGDLAVIEATRRNRNLRVERTDGPGYLIKQPDDAFRGQHTLWREAAFYHLCHREPALAAVREALPRLLYFDPAGPLLALELLDRPRNLWEHYSAFPPAQFPVVAARALGRTLGAAHRAFRPLVEAADPRLAALPRDLPWVLRVHKPGPELLAALSPANYQTLRILQTQEGLSTSLDRLGRLWQPETLIHGDVKSDNVLVLAAGDGGGAAEPAVRLVDWELAQVGDPAWDVAGALQDFVIFWVFSMPLGSGLPLDRMATGARHPLPVLHGGLRSFWRGYRTAAGLAADEGNALLSRAVRLSAARLIQSAYELAHAADALPATSVLLLQVSANLLGDPETAQVELYGLLQELPAP